MAFYFAERKTSEKGWVITRNRKKGHRTVARTRLRVNSYHIFTEIYLNFYNFIFSFFFSTTCSKPLGDRMRYYALHICAQEDVCPKCQTRNLLLRIDSQIAYPFPFWNRALFLNVAVQKSEGNSSMSGRKGQLKMGVCRARQTMTACETIYAWFTQL